jgi:outer membrane protein TolC
MNIVQFLNCIHMKNLFTVLGLLASGLLAQGQSILQGYIAYGLEHNLGIAQQELALEKRVHALREAKALFYPRLAFLGNYFLAGGGRTVDFPAGDLLNPVYATLNQLTQSSQFPDLENQSILLNPNNFYDLRFRVSVPLLNSETPYNHRIKQQQLDLQRVEAAQYQRELVRDIKVAYFRYLQSLEAIAIYQKALTLVTENRRVNESLYRNELVNKTAVIRAEQEVIRFQSLLERAESTSGTARAYFNFLLNRDFSREIEVEDAYTQVAFALPDRSGVLAREELAQLQIAQDINAQVLGLTQSANRPRVNAFADMGSQGFDWEFTDQSRYYFVGVAMEWDLFAFGQNRHKAAQVQTEQRLLESRAVHLKDQLNLQAVSAWDDYTAAVSQYEAYQSVLRSSRTNYKDFERLYREGQVLYVELLDAQNQMIQAELQVNIALYETHIKAAEIERASTLYNINQQ